MLNGDRRSNLEVVADMLRIKGSKTAIMYGANLSYSQTQKYLHLLAERQFIELVVEGNGRPLYRPTQRGRKFLELIGDLEELITQTV